MIQPLIILSFLVLTANVHPDIAASVHDVAVLPTGERVLIVDLTNDGDAPARIELGSIIITGHVGRESKAIPGQMCVDACRHVAQLLIAPGHSSEFAIPVDKESDRISLSVWIFVNDEKASRPFTVEWPRR
jgi:hypothetical protein